MNFKYQIPEKGEYDPYYEQYISLIEKENIIEFLEKQCNNLTGFLNSLSEEKGKYAYAEGKWSIKELIGHVNDVERVFSYRLFRISRKDTTPLPGFDHDVYVKNGNFNNRSNKSLIDEMIEIRRSTIALLKNISEADWANQGNVNGKLVTARALAFTLAGHTEHHVKVLKEKYL